MTVAPVPNWMGTCWAWCSECRSNYPIVDGHSCPVRMDLTATVTTTTTVFWPLGDNR